MNRARMIGAVGAAGILVGLVCRFAVSERLGELVVLGAAIVAGELLELKPGNRAPLPMSFAVFVVLAREANLLEFTVTLLAAELVATALRERPLRVRLSLLGHRVTCAFAALAGFSVVPGTDGRVAVLVGALCSIAAALVVDALFRRLLAAQVGPARPVLPARDLLIAHSADLTLASSAVLMAASVSGVDGAGDFGLWGVALFAIPSLMALYSFERLAATKAAYDQTINALAVVPEVAGWVDAGRCHRVADLAVATGSGLGLGHPEIDQLCTAALLRDLGRVCLDDPTTADVDEVLQVSAAVLSASPTLAPAGALLAAEAEPASSAPNERIGGQVLAACAAFEDVTGGRWTDSPDAAAEGVRRIASDQDGDVVGALRRGLDLRLPE
jgi:hypothetical protein